MLNKRTKLSSLDRQTHPPNTWTGGTLIGPEADEIDTVNISCRVTMTTSSCTDKLHCLCVTMIEQGQSDY